MERRDVVRVGLRLALSAAALAIIVSQIDGAALVARFATADLAIMAGAFLALLGSALAGALVWASVLPPDPPLPPLEAMRLSLIGFTINNVVPTGVGGDVYRAWALHRRGFGWPTALYSVLMDRWCAFLVLLLGLSGAAALLLTVLGVDSVAVRELVGVVLVLGLTFAVGTVVLLVWWGRLPPVLRDAGRGTASFWPEVCQRMRAFVASSRVAVTLAWAVVSMGLEGLAIALTARALGAPGSLLMYAATAPVFRVMHRVPGFVNAIGPQEMAALAVWGSLGVGAASTLPVSLALHGLRLAVGLLGVPLYAVAGNPPQVDDGGGEPTSES